MTTAQALATDALNSLGMIEMFVGDLTGEQMLHRPCDGANCCAWLLGHLVLSDRHFLGRFGVGTEELPELPDGFEERYDRSETAPRATDFGDTSILLPLLRRHREMLAEAIGRMEESVFSQTTGSDRPFFKTLGATAGFASLHTAMHAGQITTIRRSLGLPPLI